MRGAIPTNPHNLRREFAVWRSVRTTDALGGGPRTFEEIGSVRAKVSQSTAEEQTIAMATGATHSHNLHMAPDADVQRGDELRGDGEAFKVISTFTPSTPVYLRAECERRQTEPPTPES